MRDGSRRPNTEVKGELMDKDELRRLADEHRDEVTKPAREVLEHVYKALLAMPPMFVVGNVPATVRPYFSPLVDPDDGTAKCGIDIKLSDGRQLEFTIVNSGWGKSLAMTVRTQPDAGPRRG